MAEVDLTKIRVMSPSKFNGLGSYKSSELYVVETPTVVDTFYRSGANWYRIWSNGWVEQGGLLSSSSQAATATFLKPFADTNYTLLVTGLVAGSAANYNPAVTARSATNFTYNSMIGKAFSGTWYACGYMRR